MSETTQDNTEVGTGESSENTEEQTTHSSQGEASSDGTTGDSTTSEGEKPEGGKDTGDEAGDESEAGADDDTPIEYGDFDFSDYPEGFELNEDASKAFKELGQNNKIPQEAMQELIKFDAQRAAQMQDAIGEQHKATIAEWESETKADKEIGGTKLQESLQLSAKALDTFGKDAGLVEFLDQSGLGNHPAVVKTFARIGKAISEDTLVTGDEPKGQKSHAERLYGDTMSQ